MEMMLQMTATLPLKIVLGKRNNIMLSPRGCKVERKWRCKVHDISYWIKTRTTTFLSAPNLITVPPCELYRIFRFLILLEHIMAFKLQPQLRQSIGRCIVTWAVLNELKPIYTPLVYAPES